MVFYTETYINSSKLYPHTLNLITRFLVKLQMTYDEKYIISSELYLYAQYLYSENMKYEIKLKLINDSLSC